MSKSARQMKDIQGYLDKEIKKLNEVTNATSRPQMLKSLAPPTLDDSPETTLNTSVKSPR